MWSFGWWWYTEKEKKQQLRAPLQAHIQKIKMKAPSTGPSKSSDSFAINLRESPHSFGSDHVSLRKLHMAVSIKSILISRWYHRSDRRQSCTQVLITLSGTVFICLIIIPSYNNQALVRKKWEDGFFPPLIIRMRQRSFVCLDDVVFEEIPFLNRLR